MDRLWTKVRNSINSMTRGIAYTQRQQQRNAQLQQELERIRAQERPQNRRFQI